MPPAGWAMVLDKFALFWSGSSLDVKLQDLRQSLLRNVWYMLSAVSSAGSFWHRLPSTKDECSCSALPCAVAPDVGIFLATCPRSMRNDMQVVDSLSQRDAGAHQLNGISPDRRACVEVAGVKQGVPPGGWPSCPPERPSTASDDGSSKSVRAGHARGKSRIKLADFTHTMGDWSPLIDC